MNNVVDQFSNLYFKAERNADVSPAGFRRFSARDRLTICRSLKRIIGLDGFKTIHKVALMLAENDTDPSNVGHDRHAWRLRTWMAAYNSGELQKEVDDQITESKPITPTTKPVATPVTPVVDVVTTTTIDAMLVQNLRDSIKAVCKSGLKNGLTDSDLLKMLTGTLKSASEEYSVEQNELKFTAFLRQTGIDKHTALDILQRL